MKQEEREVLIQNKTDIGMSKFDACVEVRADELTQNGFSQMKKMLSGKDKQIEYLNNKINKLTEKLYGKKKTLNEQFKEKHQKILDAENGNYATTREIMRIITLLESENKPLGMSDITKTCSLKSHTAKNALNFLEKIKLIKHSEGRALMFERI